MWGSAARSRHEDSAERAPAAIRWARAALRRRRDRRVQPLRPDRQLPAPSGRADDRAPRDPDRQRIDRRHVRARRRRLAGGDAAAPARQPRLRRGVQPRRRRGQRARSSCCSTTTSTRGRTSWRRSCARCASDARAGLGRGADAAAGRAADRQRRARRRRGARRLSAPAGSRRRARRDRERPLLAGPAGTAAAYRRAAWEQVGGLDESIFAYMEDFDLALRLRSAGWGSLVAHRTPSACTSARRRTATARRASGETAASGAATCSGATACCAGAAARARWRRRPSWCSPTWRSRATCRRCAGASRAGAPRAACRRCRARRPRRSTRRSAFATRWRCGGGCMAARAERDAGEADRRADAAACC